MLHTKYQSSMPSSFRQEYFQRFCNFFPFGCHGMAELWVEFNLLNNLVELHPRNIPAKFHQDWPRGLGGDVVDDTRQTPDMGRSQKLTMSTLCSG